MAQNDLEFKNILVMHFGQLGDVILGLPALKAIRVRFPYAKITLIHGKPPTAIVKLANVADEYIPLDRVALRDGNKLKSIAEIMRLTMAFRRRKFDLVIDLHSLSETNILGFAAGIKDRLYAHRKGRSIQWLANFPIRPPDEDRKRHASLRYMDVIRPLGIDIEPQLSLTPTTEDIAIARSIVDKHGGKRLIGMFLGAGHPSRCWPLDKFAELTRQLSADEDVRCFVFLGPEEAGLRTEIEKLFPLSAIILDKLGLLELLAIYRFLDVVVGNDTGPMHLAAASDAHLVLISHESAPDEFLPLTKNLTVVRSGRIDKVAVDDVLTAISARLENDISQTK